MKKTFAARLLQTASIICIPLLISMFIIKWFSGAIPIYADIADSIEQTRIYAGIGYWNMTPHTQQIPSYLIRILAAGIDGISLALLVWGIIQFMYLVHRYYHGEIFSERTLARYARISKIAFAWTIYNPIKFTLLSMVTTLAAPTGQRVIAFALNSNDIFHIIITGFFVWITSIMQTAYTLKQDHDLTV